MTHCPEFITETIFNESPMNQFKPEAGNKLNKKSGQYEIIYYWFSARTPQIQMHSLIVHHALQPVLQVKYIADLTSNTLSPVTGRRRVSQLSIQLSMSCDWSNKGQIRLGRPSMPAHVQKKTGRREVYVIKGGLKDAPLPAAEAAL